MDERVAAPKSPLPEVGGKLASRFKEFASAQKQVLTPILKATPSEVAGWDPTTKANELTQGITSLFYKETISAALKNYLTLEKGVEDWSKTQANPEDAVAENLGVSPDKARVTRMHGGYAIYLSPQEFGKYLGISVIKDGKKVEDRGEIAEYLETMPEAGILLDQSELPQGSNLPVGVRVAVISDNFSAERAKAHEEAEVIGTFFDEAIENDPRAKNLDNIASEPVGELDRKFLRPAIYDLAARIEEGQTGINLASLGVTPNDVTLNPNEVAILNRLTRALERKLEGLSVEQQQELAQIVRGGALRSENLLSYFEEPAESQGDTKDDFRGVSLQSEKKGRFVFSKRTIPVGGVLNHENVTFTAMETLGEGGFGVTYKARSMTGEVVVIKELLSGAPEALLMSPAVADEVLANIVDSQRGMVPASDPSLRWMLDRVRRVDAANFCGQVVDLFPDSGPNRALQSNLMGALRVLRVNRKPNGQWVYYDSSDRESAIPRDVGEQMILKARDFVLKFAGSDRARALREGLSLGLQTFFNEADALSKLEGVPGVPKSYGLARSHETDFTKPTYNCLYLVEQFVPGSDTLDNAIRSGNMNQQEMLIFAAKLANVLNGIHQRDVLHKDLKPANVLVDGEKNPYIIDFGATKTRYKERNEAYRVANREDYQTIRTPGYDAPEYSRSGISDERTDIYSMGMIIYKMVTSEEPGAFSDLSGEQRYGHAQSMLNGRVPDQLRDVILRAVHPNREQRFQTAAHLEDALIRAAGIPRNVPVNIREIRPDANFDRAGLMGALEGAFGAPVRGMGRRPAAPAVAAQRPEPARPAPRVEPIRPAAAPSPEPPRPPEPASPPTPEVVRIIPDVEPESPAVVIIPPAPEPEPEVVVPVDVSPPEPTPMPTPIPEPTPPVPEPVTPPVLYNPGPVIQIFADAVAANAVPLPEAKNLLKDELQAQVAAHPDQVEDVLMRLRRRSYEPGIDNNLKRAYVSQMLDSAKLAVDLGTTLNGPLLAAIRVEVSDQVRKSKASGEYVSDMDLMNIEYRAIRILESLATQTSTPLPTIRAELVAYAGDSPHDLVNMAAVNTARKLVETRDKAGTPVDEAEYHNLLSIARLCAGNSLRNLKQGEDSMALISLFGITKYGLDKPNLIPYVRELFKSMEGLVGIHPNLKFQFDQNVAAQEAQMSALVPA